MTANNMTNEANGTQRENGAPPRRAAWAGGVALILIGGFLLLNQFLNLDLGVYIPLALGVIFLAWGISQRNAGLLIPGGILTGVGAAIVLVSRLENSLGEPAAGGLFLLILGAGFGLITLATALFADKTHWWALIPGALLALVGAAMLVGQAGLRVLEYVGMGWPVILILVGIYLLVKRAK